MTTNRSLLPLALVAAFAAVPLAVAAPAPGMA